MRAYGRTQHGVLHHMRAHGRSQQCRPLQKKLAEGVGFEPTMGLHPEQFSSPGGPALWTSTDVHSRANMPCAASGLSTEICRCPRALPSNCCQRPVAGPTLSVAPVAFFSPCLVGRGAATHFSRHLFADGFHIPWVTFSCRTGSSIAAAAECPSSILSDMPISRANLLNGTDQPSGDGGSDVGSSCVALALNVASSSCRSTRASTAASEAIKARSTRSFTRELCFPVRP